MQIFHKKTVFLHNTEGTDSALMKLAYYHSASSPKYVNHHQISSLMSSTIYILRKCILSESGFPGFEDVQDVFLIFIYIFTNCANSNIPQYQTQIQSC